MANAAPLPSIGLVLAAPEAALPGAFVIYSEFHDADWTNLRYGRRLDAALGEFALTGEDATLTESTPTAIAAAPLPSIGLLDLFDSGARVMPCEAGSFSSTRSDNQSVTATALRRGVAVIAESGAFLFTGAPAERDMEVNGETGAFNAYGQSASMLATRKLVCGTAAFAWTGVDAAGVYEQPGARRLVADAGAFSITGVDALKHLSMVLSPGAFTVTPIDTDLTGPRWQSTLPSSGSWVYVTPSGGVWTDVDPDS